MKLIIVSRNFVNTPAKSRMLAGDKWRCVPTHNACEEYLCFFYITYCAMCCSWLMSYVNVVNKRCNKLSFVFDAVSKDLVSSCSSPSYTNRYTKRFECLQFSDCSSVSISMKIGN